MAYECGCVRNFSSIKCFTKFLHGRLKTHRKCPTRCGLHILYLFYKVIEISEPNTLLIALCKFTSHFLVRCTATAINFFEKVVLKKCCCRFEELVSVCFQISGSRHFDANEEKQKVRKVCESVSR